MAERNTRDWRTWLLIASLSVNLLVIGAAVGLAIRGGPPPRPGIEPGLPAILRAMPRAYGPEVRAGFDSHRDRFERARENARQLREGLATLLLDDPVDIEAIRTLLARDREAKAELASSGEDVLIGIIRSMSRADREEFSERLRNRKDRGHHGDDDDRRGGTRND